MNHAACHIESRQRHVVGISDQGSRQIALDSLSLLHVVASMFTTSVAHGMVHVLYSVWSRRASSSGGTATPAHQCYPEGVTIHDNVTIAWTCFEDIIWIGFWNLGMSVPFLVSVSSLLLVQSSYRRMVSVCGAMNH